MENQNSPSDDRRVSGQQAHRPRSIGLKPLGEYLVEAGLLAPAQVAVALNDQTVTGLRFGEILAKRGWVREQTIEYLMDKVIEPERRSLRYSMAATQRTNASAKAAAAADTASPHRKAFVRSDSPAAETNKRPPAPRSAKMPIAVSQPVSTFRADDASVRHRKHYGPSAPSGMNMSMTPPPPPPPSYPPPPPPPEDVARDGDESIEITTCNGVSASDDFRDVSENLVWIG